MTYLRIGSSIFVAILLYATGLYSIIQIILSPLVNTAVLLVVSWAVGSQLAQRYLLPLLSPVQTKDKAVIVTGCDSGFGLFTALNLNRQGFHVVACVLQKDSDGSKRLVREAHHKARMQVVQLDVTKDDDVIALHAEVLKTISGNNSVTQLFGLVNNAGVLFNRAFEFAKAPSADDWKRTFEVNLFGVVRMTRMFLPLLRKSQGRIVNLSSQAARDSVPGFVDYSASKAAISKLTEGLQNEVSKFGVTAIGVEPFFYKTEIVNLNHMEKNITNAWNVADEEVKSAYGTEGRDELISFAQFVASQRSFVGQRAEDVSDTVCEALLTPEPRPFYECMAWSHWLGRKLRIDFLPWDIVVPIRNLALGLIARVARSTDFTKRE